MKITNLGSERTVEGLRRLALRIQSGALAIVKPVGAPQHHHAKAAGSRQAEPLPANRLLMPCLPDEYAGTAKQKRQNDQWRRVLRGQQEPGSDAEENPVAPEPVAQG